LRRAPRERAVWFVKSKNQERGKHGQLDQATTTAAESCSSVRAVIKNLSSAIERNRKKIDNRSQQRNCMSIGPMNKAQRVKPPCSHQRHE
jgi:hypothetical protein